jgi:hypothetical protein
MLNRQFVRGQVWRGSCGHFNWTAAMVIELLMMWSTQSEEIAG